MFVFRTFCLSVGRFVHSPPSLRTFFSVDLLSVRIVGQVVKYREVTKVIRDKELDKGWRQETLH